MTKARTEHRRKIERACYHRRARRFRQAGLTSRGRMFCRMRKLSGAARAAHERKVNLVNYHRRTANRAALGLNSRGQPHYLGRTLRGRAKLATLLGGCSVAVQLRRAA